MKIGRIGPVGQEKPVVFTDEHSVIDVNSVIDDWSRDSLSAGAVERVRAALESLPSEPLDDRRIGTPVARPTKIICIGMNYRKHAEETGAEIPTEPVIFMKTPDCAVGPYDDIEIPPGSTKTDYEVEMAIVIGQRLRYATSHEHAMAAVLGYTVSQDLSEREWQFERGGQFDKGKGFPTFNPCGPWIETSADFDPHNQQLSCSVDGEGQAGLQHQRHDVSGGGNCSLCQPVHGTIPRRHHQHGNTRWCGCWNDASWLSEPRSNRHHKD